jgi:hypothetical protein
VIKTVHNALILLVVALLRGALKQAFAHGVLVSEMGRRGAGWYSAAHWERTVCLVVDGDLTPVLSRHHFDASFLPVLIFMNIFSSE